MRNGLRMAELVEIAERRRRGQPPRAVRFCSSCGEVAENGTQRRVCPSCGLGVLLSASPDALPKASGGFAVVDRDLRVTAVSAAGVRILGEDATGRLLPSLVSARDGNGELSRQVARAASGLSGTARLEVSVAGRRGRFEARISPCGPPRAALVALERPSA
jgi:PAS domain-containing protein